MPRYRVLRSHQRRGFDPFEADYERPHPDVQVCDHEATWTGLLDGNGDPIMRLPNLIGFMRDDDE